VCDIGRSPKNVEQIMLERLHKVLARAGVAALRPAEDMIMAGRVTVNGRVVRELGARVDSETDVIAVDGQLVEMRREEDPYHYLAVYKPVGVISTAQDTHGRPTVVGLVPSNARLFPVGRLDGDSEGLILLTDDGDLAYRLTHPRFEVEKEYRVLLDQTPAIEHLRQWREGVMLHDEPTMPAWVEVLDRTPEGTWVRVVMREGRKRQIREVARLLGYQVLRLIRVREGPLTLGELSPGAWRELTAAEIQMLRAHTQHIPSRADEEERERRMMDRDRPEGRRLRIIRGPRRAEEQSFANDANPEQNQDAAAPSARRARVYNHTSAESAPESGTADRPRYQPPSNSQREPQSRPSSYNREARSEQSPRSYSGGRNDQQGARRPYDDRGGQRRAPEGRGYGAGAERGYRGDDRAERRPYNDNNQRSGGGRRDAGNSSEQRRPSYNDEQRGPSYGNERSGPDYGNARRESEFRSQRPSNARGGSFGRTDRSRPYGQQRDSGGRQGFDQRGPSRGPSGGPSRGPGGPPRSAERGGYGEQRQRPYGERDTGNRQRDDSRRNDQGIRGGLGASRPSRPGRPDDRAGSRGGYGRPDSSQRGASGRDYPPRQSDRRFDRGGEGSSGPRGFGRPGGATGGGRPGPPRQDDDRGNMRNSTGGGRPPARGGRFDEGRRSESGGPSRGGAAGGRPGGGANRRPGSFNQGGGAGRPGGPGRPGGFGGRSGGPGRPRPGGAGGFGGRSGGPGRPGGAGGRSGGPGRPGGAGGRPGGFSGRPGQGGADRSGRPGPGSGGRGGNSSGPPRRRPQRDDDES